MAVQTILSALIGYAFGCIQSAYLVGRIFGKIDIREHGSGNAGASRLAGFGISFRCSSEQRRAPIWTGRSTSTSSRRSMERSAFVRRSPTRRNGRDSAGSPNG